MLEFINSELVALGVPYEFMRWTSPVSYPYFVGEYSESEPLDEDGMKSSTFTITGFTRNSWLELEQVKRRIEEHFPAVCGLRADTDGGSISAYYAGSFPVETGESELKKIQINLYVKEWRNF